MFYKVFDGSLTYGPFVQFPDSTFLTLETKDILGMPYEGWYYFDTEEEAKNFFGITE